MFAIPSSFIPVVCSTFFFFSFLKQVETRLTELYTAFQESTSAWYNGHTQTSVSNSPLLRGIIGSISHSQGCVILVAQISQCCPDEQERLFSLTYFLFIKIMQVFLCNNFVNSNFYQYASMFNTENSKILSNAYPNSWRISLMSRWLFFLNYSLIFALLYNCSTKSSSLH